jgi:hypothetical protein
MSARDWNIEGITDEVIKEMKADQAGSDEIDDYVHRIAYLPVYSRDVDGAGLVAELVKEKVEEKYEEQ